MTKRCYNWLNVLFGAFCGILVGIIFMFLWVAYPVVPAMLYMIVLGQIKVFPIVGEAYGVSGNFIVGVFHSVTSIVLGVVFSLIFKRLIKGIWSGMGLGVVFGIVWWILTPFYLMPFFFVAKSSLGWSNMNMSALLNSLFSHVLYGLFLGIFYSLSKKILNKVSLDAKP